MSAIEFTEEDLERGASPGMHVTDLIRHIHSRHSIDLIVAGVARKHGLSVAELKSSGRASHLVRARKDAAIALRAQELSYPTIGRALDRDHTSIMALVKGRRPHHRREDVGECA